MSITSDLFFNPHIVAKNSVTQNFLFISFLSIAQLIIPLTSFPKAKLWANLSEEITNFEVFLLGILKESLNFKSTFKLLNFAFEINFNIVYFSIFTEYFNFLN